MDKITTFIVLVIIGCLIGGLYGIVHDQLTYTIAQNTTPNLNSFNSDLSMKEVRL
jgi:hypothetical protein